MQAQPGYSYQVLAATNLNQPLLQWSVVATGTVPFGPFECVGPAPTNALRRFYRLVTARGAL